MARGSTLLLLLAALSCDESPIRHVGDAGSHDSAADSVADQGADTPSSIANDSATADTHDGRPFVPVDWCQAGDTVLSKVVLSMTAGSWAELPQNDSLDGLQLHAHLTSWSDSAGWNPVDRRVQWVGGPGTCCADPAAYKLISYDVAADLWAVHDTPWEHNPGHAYDGSAVDPATGVHYFARSGGDIRSWDGSNWSQLSKAPIPHVVAAALTWFTDLNQGQGALVHVGPTNRVALFDGAAWSEVPETSIEGWGGYHMFAEYNPVLKLVWLGSGHGNEKKHAYLDGNLDLVQLKDAPIDLQGNGRAQKSYDPRSGKFIVYRKDDALEVWYEYDILTDTWTDISSAMQAALPTTWAETKGHRFVVPIDDCGVLLYWNHHHDTRRVFLYRHSD